MSTIYTDHPAVSEVAEKESPKRKRSHSNPPPTSEEKEQNIGLGRQQAGKKKIIPIRSFSDSSPESPYSPALDLPVYRKQRERKSKSTINLTMQEDKEVYLISKLIINKKPFTTLVGEKEEVSEHKAELQLQYGSELFILISISYLLQVAYWIK